MHCRMPAWSPVSAGAITTAATGPVILYSMWHFQPQTSNVDR
jgi:hypothetical protein